MEQVPVTVLSPKLPVAEPVAEVSAPFSNILTHLSARPFFPARFQILRFTGRFAVTPTLAPTAPKALSRSGGKYFFLSAALHG